MLSTDKLPFSRLWLTHFCSWWNQIGNEERNTQGYHNGITIMMRKKCENDKKRLADCHNRSDKKKATPIEFETIINLLKASICPVALWIQLTFDFFSYQSWWRNLWWMAWPLVFPVVDVVLSLLRIIVVVRLAQCWVDRLAVTQRPSLLT